MALKSAQQVTGLRCQGVDEKGRTFVQRETRKTKIKSEKRLGVKGGDRCTC
jgi:hypothetical protein